ncbi:hypothetical protein M885DRAFT_590311 [Pelagophyceae sp. CCMP2097]|nr:hypothetical protein M885DRAFT_590311 [Pelagophyceae sp. CCMP2097]
MWPTAVEEPAVEACQRRPAAWDEPAVELLLPTFVHMQRRAAAWADVRSCALGAGAPLACAGGDDAPLLSGWPRDGLVLARSLVAEELLRERHQVRAEQWWPARIVSLDEYQQYYPAKLAKWRPKFDSVGVVFLRPWWSELLATDGASQAFELETVAARHASLRPLFRDAPPTAHAWAARFHASFRPRAPANGNAPAPGARRAEKPGANDEASDRRASRRRPSEDSPVPRAGHRAPPPTADALSAMTAQRFADAMRIARALKNFAARQFGPHTLAERRSRFAVAVAGGGRGAARTLLLSPAHLEVGAYDSEVLNLDWPALISGGADIDVDALVSHRVLALRVARETSTQAAPVASRGRLYEGFCEDVAVAKVAVTAQKRLDRADAEARAAHASRKRALDAAAADEARRPAAPHLFATPQLFESDAALFASDVAAAEPRRPPPPRAANPGDAAAPWLPTKPAAAAVSRWTGGFDAATATAAAVRSAPPPPRAAAPGDAAAPWLSLTKPAAPAVSQRTGGVDAATSSAVRSAPPPPPESKARWTRESDAQWAPPRSMGAPIRPPQTPASERRPAPTSHGGTANMATSRDDARGAGAGVPPSAQRGGGAASEYARGAGASVPFEYAPFDERAPRGDERASRGDERASRGDERAPRGDDSTARLEHAPRGDDSIARGDDSTAWKRPCLRPPPPEPDAPRCTAPGDPDGAPFACGSSLFGSSPFAAGISSPFQLPPAPRPPPAWLPAPNALGDGSAARPVRVEDDDSPPRAAAAPRPGLPPRSDAPAPSLFDGLLPPPPKPPPMSPAQCTRRPARPDDQRRATEGPAGVEAAPHCEADADTRKLRPPAEAARGRNVGLFPPSGAGSGGHDALKVLAHDAARARDAVLAGRARSHVPIELWAYLAARRGGGAGRPAAPPRAAAFLGRCAAAEAATLLGGVEALALGAAALRADAALGACGGDGANGGGREARAERRAVLHIVDAIDAKLEAMFREDEATSREDVATLRGDARLRGGAAGGAFAGGRVGAARAAWRALRSEVYHGASCGRVEVLDDGAAGLAYRWAPGRRAPTMTVDAARGPPAGRGAPPCDRLPPRSTGSAGLAWYIDVVDAHVDAAAALLGGRFSDDVALAAAGVVAAVDAVVSGEAYNALCAVRPLPNCSGAAGGSRGAAAAAALGARYAAHVGLLRVAVVDVDGRGDCDALARDPRALYVSLRAAGDRAAADASGARAPDAAAPSAFVRAAVPRLLARLETFGPDLVIAVVSGAPTASAAGDGPAVENAFALAALAAAAEHLSCGRLVAVVDFGECGGGDCGCGNCGGASAVLEAHLFALLGRPAADAADGPTRAADAPRGGPARDDALLQLRRGVGAWQNRPEAAPWSEAARQTSK